MQRGKNVGKIKKTLKHKKRDKNKKRKKRFYIYCVLVEKLKT